MSEWDAEAKAMNEACLYLEQADQRARERFMFHLTHRFFPNGRFEAEQIKVTFDPDVLNKFREE